MSRIAERAKSRLLSLLQRLRGDLGKRREEIVDHAADVGLDFHSHRHARGQGDRRTVYVHRLFLERDGNWEDQALGLSSLTRGRGASHIGVGGGGSVGETAL